MRFEARLAVAAYECEWNEVAEGATAEVAVNNCILCLLHSFPLFTRSVDRVKGKGKARGCHRANQLIHVVHILDHSLITVFTSEQSPGHHFLTG